MGYTEHWCCSLEVKQWLKMTLQKLDNFTSLSVYLIYQRIKLFGQNVSLYLWKDYTRH